MSESSVPSSGRLDQYVVRQSPRLSRSAAAHLIEDGKVTINGKVVTKASQKVRENDEIEVDYDENAVVIPKINLPVLYEDNDCVVINKPAGVLTHSKGEFNPETTVATWLSNRTKSMDVEGERAGIVHRLDRATSGVMICAKTPEALSWLQKQFSERKVKKNYIAVARGHFKQAEAIIDMPIERNPRHPQTFRVGANGKSSITAYKVLKSNGELSLLELRPTTGRTHQLRVHLEHLGHPILGDILYGGAQADRLFLHALSLEITLPDKSRRIFEATLPAEFERVAA